MSEYSKKIVSESRFTILGCDFDPWTAKKTLSQIFDLVSSKRRGYLCTVNVSILTMMRSDRFLAGFVSRAKMVVADGAPIVWLSRYIGTPIPERVTGVDLVVDISKMAAENRWPIYLLGGSEHVLNLTARRLEELFPELQIVGKDNGYFREKETSSLVAKINNSGARILFVAMGVPRQEEFLGKNWGELGVNFAIGVGGSFDVVGGITRRAPVWIQNIGLEWLYRTIQEPRRLLWRYLKTNSQFVYLIVKEVVFRPDSRKPQSK